MSTTCENATSELYFSPGRPRILFLTNPDPPKVDDSQSQVTLRLVILREL